MEIQVILTLPDTVYSQAEQVAHATNRQVADVLRDTIVQAFPALHESKHRPAMQREKAAFQAMHPELLQRYNGQYVAIHQGQVIDHDADQLMLVRRIDEKYPDQIVLIKQVTPRPREELNFRSPRIVRN